jgi:hypothetical protein
VITEGYGYVGGLVGSIITSSILNSFASGNVQGDNYVGGLVGYVAASSIENTYTTGDVAGTGAIGGLVGATKSNSWVSIINSYSAGIIKGDNGVGGIIGSVLIDNSTLENSYFVGSLEGSDHIGAIVGYLSYTTYDASPPPEILPIENCYWLDANGNVPNDYVKSISIDNKEYFYRLSNEPLGSWSSPPWGTVCEGKGLPIFNWQVNPECQTI